jgi:thioredoxin 1
MKNSRNLIIVAALTLAVVAAFALKPSRSSTGSIDTNPGAIAGAVSADTGPASSAQLPRLLALGADQCVPCKMMQPGLAALRDEYADRFVTEFIDVWKNRDAAMQYRIRAIPTQIFFAADGRELFRHEGFYPKEGILARWRELGVELE